MAKYIVGIDVFYSYEVELPDSITDHDEILEECDVADPVLESLNGIIKSDKVLHGIAEIASIINEETGTNIYG